MTLWHACLVAALALLGRAAFSNQVTILTTSIAAKYACDADEQMVKNSHGSCYPSSWVHDLDV